jgi:predicted PurR-regulated permease PerM
VIHLRIFAFSSVILLASLLFSIMMAIIVVVILSLNTTAVGQTSSSSVNRIQTWTDKLNNLKIQFTYSPENPAIDTPTELKFNVLNLQTGSNLKDLSARIAVLTNSGGQQRSFKFTNISAADGNFSVKYLFPDSGSYQVISKIDSNDSSTLASFNVFVPLQPLGTINVSNLNPLILPALLAGVIGTIAIVTLVWISKKKVKKYNM